MRRHVYFYTHLDSPYRDIAAAFSGDPGMWLPAPAAADGDGWRVELKAEGALPGPLATHGAAVRVGAVAGEGGELWRSITWSSLAAQRFFPVLEGDLELMELHGSGCQLSLMASYRPPLSVIGDAGDRLLGRQIAEACVRRFVLEAAGRLAAVTLHA